MVKRSWIFVLSAINIFAFQNCTPARFAPLDSDGKDLPMSTVREATASSNALCTANGAAGGHSLKVLFVVDNSSSTDSTDKGKYFRVGSMRNFFSQFDGKSGFSWGLIAFSANITSYFGSNVEPAFARSGAIFGSAIDHYSKIGTEGGTDYTSALAAARAAIAHDPDLNDQVLPPLYLVIFMSDGEPYPADQHVSAEVQSIMDVAPGRVSVNTVYFGQEVAENEARLQAMSDIGKGRFFNTNVVGTKIDFASAAQLPSKACVQ